MAPGQHYSAHQRKIIDRYYDNLDTIQLTRLAETVSDLFMAAAEGDEKKQTRLWKKAGDTLAKLRTEPPLPRDKWSPIVEARDLTALSALVNELSGPGGARGGPGGARGARGGPGGGQPRRGR